MGSKILGYDDGVGVHASVIGEVRGKILVGDSELKSAILKEKIQDFFVD
jgi:hypothetical protein